MMLKARVLTSVILLPVFISAIVFLPAFYFFALLGLFIAIGAWEWSLFVDFKHLLNLRGQTSKSLVQKIIFRLNLTGLISRQLSSSDLIFRFTYVAVVVTGLFFVTLFPVGPLLFFSVLFWLWAAFAILAHEKDRFILGFQLPLIRALAGFFILTTCWASILFLKNLPLGSAWLVFILMVIVAADVGAYFFGSRFGKTPLTHRVSPNKTREGFLAGMISAGSVAFLGGFFFHLSMMQHLYLISLAFMSALFSVLGDLTVSLFKRLSGVKDAGKIFPGHGGVLDRLDSIAAAVVIFALGIYLCNL